MNIKRITYLYVNFKNVFYIVVPTKNIVTIAFNIYKILGQSCKMFNTNKYLIF